MQKVTPFRWNIVLAGFWDRWLCIWSRNSGFRIADAMWLTKIQQATWFEWITRFSRSLIPNPTSNTAIKNSWSNIVFLIADYNFGFRFAISNLNPFHTKMPSILSHIVVIIFLEEIDKSPEISIPRRVGTCSFRIWCLFLDNMRSFLNVAANAKKERKNSDFDSFFFFIFH